MLLLTWSSKVSSFDDGVWIMNFVLKLKDFFCKSGDADSDADVNKTLGCLLHTIVLTTGTIGPFFTLVFVYCHLDPFYAVFENHFLPHSYERTVFVIIFTPLTRFLLFFLCVTEF